MSIFPTRILRLADGPDEVPRVAIAKQELKKKRKGTLVTEKAKSE